MAVLWVDFVLTKSEIVAMTVGAAIAIGAMIAPISKPSFIRTQLGKAFDADLASMRELALTTDNKLMLACVDDLQAERATGRLRTLPIQPAEMPKACEEMMLRATQALDRALDDALRHQFPIPLGSFRP